MRVFNLSKNNIVLVCQIYKIFILKWMNMLLKHSEEDTLILKELQAKAKTYKEETGKSKSLYDDIINVWTHQDPIKRNVAKKNNLNYIEIFGSTYTLSEIQAIIENYISSR